MRRRWLGFALALAALPAACGEQLPTAESEVAAELRALRAALVHAPQAAAPATDPGRDLAAAMAPLRDVLTALNQRTAELENRQLALTQELQRWTTLLVDSASQERRDEGDAIRRRLQDLETSLAAQEQRHREVEKILQGALDRTTEQLDIFLRRLGETVLPGNAAPSGPAPASPATGTPPTKPTQPPAPANGSPSPANASPVQPGQRAARAAPGMATRWWPWVALATTLLGLGCFLRLRRPGRANRDGGALGSDGPPAFDPGVQDIWAAAALLGEAVDRLRQQQAEAGSTPAAACDGAEVTAVPTAPATAADDGPALDEFFVIEDDLPGEPAANGPDAAPDLAAEAERLVALPRSTERTAREAAATRRPAPPTLYIDVPVRDGAPNEAEVARLLADDPRVLRSPAPRLALGRDAIAVRCHLLPDLPPGEIAHLEQRLRAAGR